MTARKPARPPVERPLAGGPGAPPLFMPHVPFPPYRFVPGHAPHPFAHEGGYAYGQRTPVPPYLPESAWRENVPYLRGLDFFNRGWWWEAHESWESYWHVAKPRDARQELLFRALIQFAACALNRERGQDGGAGRLLLTAMRALDAARVDAGGGRVCGLDLAGVAADMQMFLAEPNAVVNGLYLRPA